MVDGLTGSGKSTVIRAVQNWAEACGHRVFRLSDWKEDAPPRFDDVSEYDVFFTYEPTRTWIGRAIRYELSRNDEPYGGEELAHAFSLDRQIMYRRLIIPALQAGKTIIQDRGVSTSLVYQPIMPKSLPIEAVMKLPGNALALNNPPNALVLTRLSAQEAKKRIEQRDDDGKGVFADLALLERLEKRFEEPWLKELFVSRGSNIFELEMSGPLEQTTRNAQQLIDHILSIC